MKKIVIDFPSLSVAFEKKLKGEPVIMAITSDPHGAIQALTNSRLKSKSGD
jgi:hypothetical protein